LREAKMRNRNIAVLAIVVSSLALASCASVTSDMPTARNATGEAWYVKSYSLFGLPLSLATQIYYCPTPASPKDDYAVCTKAEMLDKLDAPPTNATTDETPTLSELVKRQAKSPPRFVDIKVENGRVTGVVEDDGAKITVLQLSEDGGKNWITLRPKDGKLDSNREELDYPVPSSASPETQKLMLRAIDAGYSSATVKVEANATESPSNDGTPANGG
jgi:hypothetical protein